jgi:N-acyl-phosphatidylethanolamine-hydrolysing phospholipase D
MPSLGFGGPAPLPPTHVPEIRFPRADASELRITAIGHSSFLLQVGGLNVLTDPVFAERASPIQWVGPRRLRAPGLARESLPPIDLVLQSHDHYDHLDLGTARWLARRDPTATWCVPLGVARRLRAVGVRRLVELDWWMAAAIGQANVVAVPAAHFSGRTPFDRDATLWCGWSLRVGSRSVHFAGDTGMHPEFRLIGDRVGPWDAIMLPVGAYSPRWFMRPVHMDPDEALAAYDALAGGRDTVTPMLVAMHWGTFRLSDEPVEEPIARVRAGWAARGGDPADLLTLEPGESSTIRIVR